MMRTRGLLRRWTSVFLAGIAAAAAGQAQLSTLGPDLPGALDSPLISRYPGAQLIGFEDLGFEQAGFWTEPERPVSAQGQVTRRLYLLPPGKTAMEIHRHYEQALRTAGAHLLTAADAAEPGWDSGEHWRTNFLPLVLRKPFAADITPFDRNAYYAYGTLRRNGGEVHVSVLTGNSTALTHAAYKVPTQDALTAVAIQVVEPKILTSGNATGTIQADTLRRLLAAEGKAVASGLQFDLAGTELRLESRPQVEQIAVLMRQRPTMGLVVVGHTDSEGNAEANLQLSLARAQAVVNALVRDHGIAPERLAARGVGSLSPLASNATAEGRARNRRVELVVAP